MGCVVADSVTCPSMPGEPGSLVNFRINKNIIRMILSDRGFVVNPSY